MMDVIPPNNRPWRRLAVGMMMLATCAVAFQPTARLQQPTTTTTTTTTRKIPSYPARRRLEAAMDPNDLANIASSAAAHHLHHWDPSTSWDAIISTLYSTTLDLKPAHGHTQPLFGPPDPYLTGEPHSIPPNLKALDVTATPPLTADQAPDIVKPFVEKGGKVMDSTRFEAGGGSTLPGFKPLHPIPGVGSALDVPKLNGATPNQVRQAAQNYWALQKIPTAALVYVLIDFFFLRRDVDLYKEDIEEERDQVAAETVAVTGVRLAAFFILGGLTVLFFGHVP